MKKIFLAGATAVMFLGAAIPAASAYTLVNGQAVFGFVRGIAPEPTMPAEPMPEIAVQPQITISGNTTIYDLLARINAADRQLLLDIVNRAKIAY